MRLGTWRTLFRSERGIALPTAMIALMLLTTLLIAFAVLSKSEPTIASNQVRAASAMRGAISTASMLRNGKRARARSELPVPRPITRARSKFRVNKIGSRTNRSCDPTSPPLVP